MLIILFTILRGWTITDVHFYPAADNDTPQDRTGPQAVTFPPSSHIYLNFSESMVIDATKKVSTHGPRGSRHEEWRKSKGLNPRPSVNSTNRQGVPSGRRKAGRSKRRRWGVSGYTHLYQVTLFPFFVLLYLSLCICIAIKVVQRDHDIYIFIGHISNFRKTRKKASRLYQSAPPRLPQTRDLLARLCDYGPLHYVVCWSQMALWKRVQIRRQHERIRELWNITHGNSAIVICSVVTRTSGRVNANFWVLGNTCGAMLWRAGLLCATDIEWM